MKITQNCQISQGIAADLCNIIFNGIYYSWMQRPNKAKYLSNLSTHLYSCTTFFIKLSLTLIGMTFERKKNAHL